MSWPVSLLPSVAECILGDDILEACLYFMDTLFFSPLFIQIPPLSLFCYSFFFALPPLGLPHVLEWLQPTALETSVL